MNNNKNNFGKRLLTLIFCIFWAINCAVAAPSAESFIKGYQESIIQNQPQEALATIQSLINGEELNAQERFFVQYNLSYALFRLNNKAEVLPAFEQTINLTESLDRYHQSKSLLARAKTHGILFRDAQTAITDLQRAEQLLDDSLHQQKNQLRFDIQTSLAQAYNQLGELDAAQKAINDALLTSELLNDKSETIYALIISGRIAYQQEKFQQAFELYVKALALTDDKTPRKQIASIELRLASAYEKQGYAEQSLKHAQNAVELYAKLPDKRMKIMSLRVLGNIQMTLTNDVNGALINFLNGLSLAKEVKDPHFIGQLQYLIGKAYLLDNDQQKAQDYFLKAQSMLTASNATYYFGYNNLELAQLYILHQNLDEAKKLLVEIIEQPSLENYPDLIATSEQKLLAIYRQAGDFEAALHLQAKLVGRLEQQLELKTKQTPITPIEHSVELKTLQNQFAKLTSAHKATRQQLQQNQKNSYWHYTLMLLLILTAIVLFSRYRQQVNVYQLYQANSQLLWPEFINQIRKKSHLLRIKQLNGGILISTLPQEFYRSATPFLLAQWLADYQQWLKTHNGNLLSTAHGLSIWSYSTEDITSCATKLMQTATLSEQPVHFWFDNSELDTGLSSDMVMVLQHLIDYGRTQIKHINEPQLYVINIDEKALASIFKSPDIAEFTKLLPELKSQGLLRFTPYIN